MKLFLRLWLNFGGTVSFWLWYSSFGLCVLQPDFNWNIYDSSISITYSKNIRHSIHLAFHLVAPSLILIALIGLAPLEENMHPLFFRVPAVFGLVKFAYHMMHIPYIQSEFEKMQKSEKQKQYVRSVILLKEVIPQRGYKEVIL